MTKPTISIIGCGWLGLPLAKHLIQQGYTVKGSTTSKDKIATLEANNINAFLLEVGEQGLVGEHVADLLHSDVLLLNIPPRARKAGPAAIDRHLKEMRHLLAALEQSPVQQILFASSTSVYNDSNTTVTESAVLAPKSVSGKALIQVEQLFQKHQQFTTTVLRFGGLFGGSRHPARYMAGRKNLSNGHAPVNLVHLDDCIGVIQQIIEQQKWGEIYNVLADQHPSRQDYYTQKALDLGLEPPQFDPNTANGNWKIVSNTKVKQALDYNFQAL